MNDPERLIHGTSETGALLASLEPPRELDEEARERIERGLARRGTSGAPLAAVVVFAGLVGTIGGASAATWYRADGASAEIVSIASGTIVAYEDGQPPRLVSGHVAVRTATTGVRIEAPDAILVLEPSTTAELEVDGGRTVRAAAVAGAARLEWRIGDPLALRPGRAYAQRGPVELPKTRELWLDGLFVELPEPSKAEPAKPAPTGDESRALIELEPEEQVAADGAELLDHALELLARRDEAAAALALRDYGEYWGEHAIPEAGLDTMSEALVRAKNPIEALAWLDRAELSGSPRGQLLRARRAKLRADASRCADAILDYDAILAAKTIPELAEAALYGRAICKNWLGERAAAVADFTRYVDEHPEGARIREVQARLRGRKLP